MKLSIIIVNYKMAPLVKGLVESLLSQELPKRTEIIVVDNDSQDNSVFLLRSDFPEITVIDNKENLGLASGVNTGIRHARGQYYLILNPDMIALPPSITTLVSFMDAHSDVGAAGGKLISPNGELQESCYRFYSPMTVLRRRTWLGRTKRGRRDIDRFLMKEFDHESTQDVDWIMGACMIVRAKAVGNVDSWKKTPTIHEVGGMDERYFLYFEDVDWCRRMWQAGWRVTYVPEAQFSHFHQRSSDKGTLLSFFTNRSKREHILSALKYFWKFRKTSLPR